MDTAEAQKNGSEALTPKYDWYQTDAFVVVTVMMKKVQPKELSVNFGDRSLSVGINREGGKFYALDMSLSHEIKPDKCSYKIMSTKIECKLIKDEGIRWSMLQGEEVGPSSKMNTTPAEEDTQQYPSSSHYTRDWNKVVADIKEQEKNEKPEGEEALNQLFQNIYKDGDDNLRKAMNKSFQESGGTVLSTNWKDIGEAQTDVKPPDGMEFKKYEI